MSKMEHSRNQCQNDSLSATTEFKRYAKRTAVFYLCCRYNGLSRTKCIAMHLRGQTVVGQNVGLAIQERILSFNPIVAVVHMNYFCSTSWRDVKCLLNSLQCLLYLISSFHTSKGNEWAFDGFPFTTKFRTWHKEKVWKQNTNIGYPQQRDDCSVSAECI